jgi:hypothetical protein
MPSTREHCVVPTGLDDAIARALRRDHALRYRTAVDFALALLPFATNSTQHYLARIGITPESRRERTQEMRLDTPVRPVPVAIAKVPEGRKADGVPPAMTEAPERGRRSAVPPPLPPTTRPEVVSLDAVAVDATATGRTLDPRARTVAPASRAPRRFFVFGLSTAALALALTLGLRARAALVNTQHAARPSLRAVDDVERVVPVVERPAMDAGSVAARADAPALAPAVPVAPVAGTVALGNRRRPEAEPRNERCDLEAAQNFARQWARTDGSQDLARLAFSELACHRWRDAERPLDTLLLRRYPWVQSRRARIEGALQRARAGQLVPETDPLPAGRGGR